MAYSLYNKGGHTIVHEFTDVANDMFVNGVIVGDTIFMIVDNAQGSGPTTVEFTNSSEEDIKAGNAHWVEYDSVSAGSNQFYSISPGPVAVRINSSDANVKAWIRT